MAQGTTASSCPITLSALGGPGRSQSNCQRSKAPSLSHAKEEVPCAAEGKAGWVPTIVHSPTKISNSFSDLVGWGGCSACSSMCGCLSYSWACQAEGGP